MNHFSQQLNMSHISQCKPLVPAGPCCHQARQLECHVYAHQIPNEANIAGVLTFDEARRIAVNVARVGSF